MKKYLIFSLILMFFSCEKKIVVKPEKLIEEDKMIAIFYDLALIDAIKTNQPNTLENNNIDPKKYIYDKYNIDSLQFVQNNKFYASDIEKYLKMYSEVNERIESNKNLLDSIGNKKIKKENLGELGGQPPVMN